MTLTYLIATFPNDVPATREMVARQYARLTGEPKRQADIRIQRHIRCCDKCEVPYDLYALVEIVRDASQVKVYAQMA